MSFIDKAFKKYLEQQDSYKGKEKSGKLSDRAKVNSHIRKELTPRGSSNDLTVDLESLANKGILTPETKNKILAEELRQIKRQVIRDTYSGESTDLLKNLIVVTSSIPDEGKTFISVNLAMSIAMGLDHEVVLIDADGIRRGLTRMFSDPEEFGLYDYLSSHKDNISGLINKTDVTNLSVIFAGAESQKTAELLSSRKMKSLVEALVADENKLVIIDTPPILAASDASILSSIAGQTLMIVNSADTAQNQVSEALSRIDSTSSVKFILNKRKYPAFMHSYYSYANY